MFEQQSATIMWVPPMHMSRTMLEQCGYGRCPLPALRETML